MTNRVYSFWGGWSNTPIPEIGIDGIVLAFAQMMNSGGENYYTDYARSNNFQQCNQSPNTTSYPIWNQWIRKYFGGTASVSYGGSNNPDLRQFILNGSPATLDRIAGEIRANVSIYNFDGVDIDIEDWWSYTPEQNIQFALNLSSVIKTLRSHMDSSLRTRNRQISLAVGTYVAGPVPGMPSQSSNLGSMLEIFQDTAFVNAISHINIMSYNTGMTAFYKNLSVIDNLLSTFHNAGIPKEKLVLGVQPIESGGQQATEPSVIQALAAHLKDAGYGGIFLWGVGVDQPDPASYLNAIMAGFGRI